MLSPNTYPKLHSNSEDNAEGLHHPTAKGVDLFSKLEAVCLSQTIRH